MTIYVFYDRDRRSAPWCVHYHVAGTTGELHFESRHIAEKYARGKGWRPELRDELIHFLDELFCDDPEHAADVLLDRFNITERDTTT